MDRLKLTTKDGKLVDTTNPLPITGAVTATPSNTADTKITLDGEIVATTGAPGVVGPWTIANGQSLSDAVEIGTNALGGIYMPAAFTGTVLTFQVALTLAGTYQNLYDDSGTEVSATVAAGRGVSLDFAALKIGQWRFLKIRSGTSAAPTAEGGERAIYFATK